MVPTGPAEFNIVSFDSRKKKLATAWRTELCCYIFSHCSHIPVAFLVSVALFFQIPSYMRKACKPNKFIILKLRTEHIDQSYGPFLCSQPTKQARLGNLYFKLLVKFSLCSVESPLLSRVSEVFFSYQRNNKSKWCMNSDFNDNNQVKRSSVRTSAFHLSAQRRQSEPLADVVFIRSAVIVQIFSFLSPIYCNALGCMCLVIVKF